jgi:hypothetical protein
LAALVDMDHVMVQSYVVLFSISIVGVMNHIVVHHVPPER